MASTSTNDYHQSPSFHDSPVAFLEFVDTRFPRKSQGKLGQLLPDSVEAILYSSSDLFSAYRVMGS